MRIAICTETYLPDANGVATHIAALRNGLTALGHEALIVRSDRTVRHYSLHDGILWCPAIPCPARWSYRYSLASPVSAKRLAILRRWKPDIIHIQNEFGQGLFGIQAAKLLKIPLVYTLHTMYDDYLYYIAGNSFLPAARREAHRYLRFLSRRAQGLIGASPKIAEYFASCGVTRPVTLIPNGVQLCDFSENRVSSEEIFAVRREAGVSSNELLACFCGRIAREKNLDTLLRFWARIVKNHSNLSRCRLLIIGGGPDLEEMIQSAKSLSVENSVIFTGGLSHDKLPVYYHSCDVYITASLSENHSVSTLEAMASGLPVFHLRDPLNEYQYQEGTNGFVFDTAEDLGRLLENQLRLSTEERQIQRNRVRASVTDMGIDTMARRTETVYKIAQREKNQEFIQKHSRRCRRVYRWIHSVFVPVASASGRKKSKRIWKSLKK